MTGLTTRAIAMLLAGLAIVALLIFGARSCEQRRNAASQARVEQEQAGAAQESARDAINAVAASGERESASEELTRSNERDIRNAEGANATVAAGVRDAGIASLCSRAAYRDHPKCRVQFANPK